ncbi:MAG: glycosyltransferase family 4 protein [Myxococcota bacterium]|nr:glycosyltransferase family 4 protein [Myxococcota bacterium]
MFEIARHLRRARPFLVTQCESEYTARWRKAGFDVLVWTLPRSDRRVSRLPARVARNASLLALNYRFAAVLRERGVRVVHCNDGSAMAMAGFGARRAGARIALNIRDTALGNLTKWRGYRLLAEEIVVLSEEMRAFVEDALRLPATLAPWGARISSIYSVVDVDRLAPLPELTRAELRRSLGIAPGTCAVGVVAAFVPKKQQLDLLRALAREIQRLPPELDFYFVGDFEPESDAYARACRDAVETSSLRERVRFVGFTPEPERWYQALDLTLLPSRTEGLARSTIESMASGTPVIAFDFCSAREVLERHGAGIVMNQGDFRGLLDAVRQLAEDLPRRQRCAEQAVRAARSLFRASDVAGAYDELYERLAALASGRSQSF